MNRMWMVGGPQEELEAGIHTVITVVELAH